MIQINAEDPQPKYKQIVNQLRRKIMIDEMTPGTKLPSVRGLAMGLAVNTNTIVKAYAQLTEEGLIESRQGAGVFVCNNRQKLTAQQQDSQLQQALKQFVNETLRLDYSKSELIASVSQALETIDNKTLVNKDEHV